MTIHLTASTASLRFTFRAAVRTRILIRGRWVSTHVLLGYHIHLPPPRSPAVEAVRREERRATF
jgi:hypothetical protein